MSWNVIKWVSGPVSLLALVLLVVLYFVRAKLSNRVKLLEASPEHDRIQMAELILDTMSIPIANLPSTKCYELAMERLLQRRSRFTQIVYLIALGMVLFTLLYMVAVYNTAQGAEMANVTPPLASSATANSSSAQLPCRPGGGSDRRYEVTSCGSIIDKDNNVEWCVGPDRDMDWDDAKQWVAGLAGCGSKGEGWRLPSTNELRSIHLPASGGVGRGHEINGNRFRARLASPFSGIGGGAWVWSRTSEGDDAEAYNYWKQKEDGKVTIRKNRSPKQAGYPDYSVRAFAIRKL